MTLPESNLPPDAQKWRRAVEKDLAELKKAAGISSTNLKTARARFTGVANQAAAVGEAVQAVVQEVVDIAQAEHRNDRSNWEPKPPENPRHNQRWFDTTDGNLMRVWIDHGAYPRINYALNPNFAEGTDNWTAVGIGGSLSWEGGTDPHAVLTNLYSPAPTVMEEVTGRTVVNELEATAPDEDGEGGTATSFVGVPWSASAHVTAFSDNLDGVTAVLEVVGPSGNVLASSGTVTLPIEQMTTLYAPSAVNEYEIAEAKTRLSISGLTLDEYVTVDKIMLEAVEEPEEDYFDGDMPGVEWQILDQGRVSVWDGVPAWHILQDQNAIQQAIDTARDTLAAAFTTSVNAPTPADGVGKAEGMYWTQINEEGEQVARWRWAEGQWVSTPIAPEFIPEAYVDFLAANVALIEQLLAHNIDVTGHLNITGTFAAESTDYEIVITPQGIQLIAKINPTLDGTITTQGLQEWAHSMDAFNGLIYSLESSAQDSSVIRVRTSTGAVQSTISPPSGWRFSRLRVKNSRIYASVINTTTNVSSLRVMTLTGGLVRTVSNVVYEAAVNQDEEIFEVITESSTRYVRRRSSTGTVLNQWVWPYVGDMWSPPIMEAHGDYVWVSWNADVWCYTRAGALVSKQSYGQWHSDIRVYDDTLLVSASPGSQTSSRIVGIDVNTGATEFAWLLDMYAPWNIALDNGTLYISRPFPSHPTTYTVIARYVVGELPQSRASMSTVTGILAGEGAELRGNTTVDTLDAGLIRGVGGGPVRIPSIIAPIGVNIFDTIAERDAALVAKIIGTKALTRSPLIQEWVWTGSEWLRTWAESSGQPYAQAAGVVTVTGTGAQNAAELVAFPTGRFTQPPVVVATGQHSAYLPYVSDPSASAVGIGLRHWNGNNWTASIPVHWHAVQMTPTSAEG